MVTGGSRGIGLGIACALAKEGYDLVICGRRERCAVSEVVSALGTLGTEVLYVQADVSLAADRRRSLEATKDHFGALNVLVNNAGVAPEVRADILEATEESFERLIKNNVQGPYFLTQAAAAWMIEEHRNDPGFWGCIVNISSVSATIASPNRGDYCISKAALSMCTKLWATRLAPFGLMVYEIRPGVMRTDMTASAVVKESYDRLIEHGLLLQPRWGQPEDVGKAVAMLARGDLAYSTGTVITVDGGWTVPRL